MEAKSNHFEVIHSIVSNKNLIIDEQIKALNEYKKSVEIAVESTKRSLQMELLYCPSCDEYYRKQSFEKTIYKEYSKNKDLYTLDTTAKEYPCYICPKGHKIIDNYE